MKKNPWAICTSSVGRKDKKKYERCVKSVKRETNMKESIKNARVALAERCWVGWKKKGMKKKGNRIVPDCVKEENEVEKGAERIKTAAKKAKKHGGDPLEAIDKVVDRLYQAGDKPLQK